MSDLIQYKIVEETPAFTVIVFTQTDESIRGNGDRNVVYTYDGIDMCCNNRPTWTSRGPNNRPTLWLPGRNKSRDGERVAIPYRSFEAVRKMIEAYNGHAPAENAVFNAWFDKVTAPGAITTTPETLAAAEAHLRDMQRHEYVPDIKIENELRALERHKASWLNKTVGELKDLNNFAFRAMPIEPDERPLTEVLRAQDR